MQGEGACSDCSSNPTKRECGELVQHIISHKHITEVLSLKAMLFVGLSKQVHLKCM